MTQTDVAIIGGGIVGLATAYRLLERFPGTAVTILEKEATLAFHQTGRNSGVLHSGIYYKPGSLRATNCREGKKAMEEFCQREGVAYDICGKVIVAVSEEELPKMNDIFARGQANGVKCELIGPERLRELEPHTAGIAAIHVPEAGIVDYPGVCQKLADRIREMGGSILFNAQGDFDVAIERADDRADDGGRPRSKVRRDVCGVASRPGCEAQRHAGRFQDRAVSRRVF